VKGVADQDHQAAAAVIAMTVVAVTLLRRRVRVMNFAFLDMAVTPQHQFFQYEEAEDAEQHGGGSGLNAVALVEGMRQHFDEGCRPAVHPRRNSPASAPEPALP